MKRLPVLLFALAAVAGCGPAAPPPSALAPSPPPSDGLVHDDADAVIWRFGKPDADQRNGFDMQNHFAARRIIYDNEDVEIWFRPEPPPHHGWRYDTAGSTMNNDPFTPAEVEKRLAAHDRGRPPAELIAPGAKLSGKP